MASVFTRLASIIRKRKTETATRARYPRCALPNRFIAGSSLWHDSKCCGNLSDHQTYEGIWAELTGGSRRVEPGRRNVHRNAAGPRALPV
jgi:hypothetical protein